jgi:hypothetical protein
VECGSETAAVECEETAVAGAAALLRYAPCGATSYSLKTSTWLDPANRISLMVFDPSGLVA